MHSIPTPQEKEAKRLLGLIRSAHPRGHPAGKGEALGTDLAGLDAAGWPYLRVLKAIRASQRRVWFALVDGEVFVFAGVTWQ